MTLTMMLLLAAAIVLPLVWIARRHSTGKTVKKPLIAHCFGFFAPLRFCLYRIRLRLCLVVICITCFSHQANPAFKNRQNLFHIKIKPCD